MSTGVFPPQSEERKTAMNRRDLFKTVTAAAAGLVTIQAASKGVALILNKMRGELESCMVLTGMANVASVNRSILA